MWKTIPTLNRYECNENGEIREKETQKIISQYSDKDGYKLVHLYTDEGKRKAFRAHRLIAYSFILNPDNLPVVNHIDHDKMNNHVDNLEWVTYSYNSQHSYHDGWRDEEIRKCIPEMQKKAAEQSKAPVAQYDQDGNLIAVFSSQKEASEKTGVCRSSITHVVRGQRKTAGGYIWRYVEGSTTKTPENLTGQREISAATENDIV